MATPQQFASRLKTRAQAFEKAVVKAEAQTLKEADAEARRLSSGGYSLSGLKKAGHPFSRRRPNGAFSPALVHLGGGRGDWRAGFKTRAPRVVGGDVVSRLTNSDPSGKWLDGGTGRMVDRWGPQKKAIIAKVGPGRLRRLKAVRL